MVWVLTEAVTGEVPAGSGCGPQPGPEIPPIATDMMNPRYLVAEDLGRSSGSCGMISLAVERLLELEMGAMTGALCGARVPA